MQRVAESSVAVDDQIVSRIDKGLLVLVGIGHDDEEQDANLLAEKISGLRCFADDASKFNLSVVDTGGSILVISQFTLFGDCRKGRRPSFSDAARPEKAIPLYERFVESLRGCGLHVETGQFGAHMDVHIVNDGPVTLLLDTKRVF